MVKRWLERGRIFRVQPRVYSLTPGVPARGRMMAAALTLGRDAVLSHRAAAAVWGLGAWPTGTIDVTVPGRRQPRRGIRLHRACVSRVVKESFPVTTVTRTLVDLAGVLPLERLRDAFEHAERLGLLCAKEVYDEMPGRRGARKIRAVLSEWSDPEPTKNEFEQSLRELCREYDLPLPSQNVILLGYEVDAFWEPALVVELDGWEWHRTRRSFEEDRRRAAALEAAGYRVLRFSWSQVRYERAAVAAAIRSGCPRAGGRDRSPARAAARPPSAP